MVEQLHNLVKVLFDLLLIGLAHGGAAAVDVVVEPILPSSAQSPSHNTSLLPSLWYNPFT